MKDDEKSREITATEFAKIKGKSASWGRWLAQKAAAKGKKIPRKVGNYWLATEKEWESVIKSLGIRGRRRKRQKNR